MNNLPSFSTHSVEEVLNYYWELYDNLKEAQKKDSIEGILSEEEEIWFIEMTKFLEWKKNNSG
jgi:hypothetical protein